MNSQDNKEEKEIQEGIQERKMQYFLQFTPIIILIIVSIYRSYYHDIDKGLTMSHDFFRIIIDMGFNVGLYVFMLYIIAVVGFFFLMIFFKI